MPSRAFYSRPQTAISRSSPSFTGLEIWYTTGKLSKKDQRRYISCYNGLVLAQIKDILRLKFSETSSFSTKTRAFSLPVATSHPKPVNASQFRAMSHRNSKSFHVQVLRHKSRETSQIALTANSQSSGYVFTRQTHCIHALIRPSIKTPHPCESIAETPQMNAVS